MQKSTYAFLWITQFFKKCTLVLYFFQTKSIKWWSILNYHFLTVFGKSYKNSVLVKLYICFCFNEVVGNSKYLLVYDVSAAVICKMGCSFPSVVFSKITCYFFIKYNLLYFNFISIYSISRNDFQARMKKSSGFRCTVYTWTAYSQIFRLYSTTFTRFRFLAH